MSAPPPRRVPLPVVERLPRVGVLRIGETYASPTDAKPDRLLPRKLDHFRVDPEDGTTLPEAAASFKREYGDEPKRIRVAIPGDSPDDVLRGSWRQYGTGKLKIQCDGTTCEERTDTGGWVTAPCVCEARKIPASDKRRHCALTYALELILPDIEGVGVWSISTGSEISVRQLTADLQIVRELNGTLRQVPFILEVVETNVAPDGKATKVYTLRARVVGATPADLMGGKYRGEREGHGYELPPPIDDEQPNRELHASHLALNAPDASSGDGSGSSVEGAAGNRADVRASEPEPAFGAGSDPATEGGAPSAAGASGSEDPAPGEPLWQAVERQMDALSSHQQARLVKLCKQLTIKPTRDGLIDAWGEGARDLVGMCESVEARLAEATA